MEKMFFTILIILVFVGTGIWWFFFKSKPALEEPVELAPEPIMETPPIQKPPPPVKKPEKPNFMISPQWDGAREGYVFKNGSLGVGYYRDRPRVSFGSKEVMPYSPQESPYQTGLRSKKLV